MKRCIEIAAMIFFGLLSGTIGYGLRGVVESEELMTTDSASESLWYSYYKARVNVRYRDVAGDDGLREAWNDVAGEALQLWQSDAPTKAQADAIYQKAWHVQKRETEPPDLALLDKAQADIDAEVKEQFGKSREGIP